MTQTFRLSIPRHVHNPAVYVYIHILVHIIILIVSVTVLYSQSPLCTWNFALFTLYFARRHTNSNRQCFECALCSVMIVIAADAVDVHRDAGGLGEALQAMGNHLRAQLAQPFPLQAEFNDAIWSVGQVDNRSRERFIEGGVCVTETGETSRRSEGFGEGVAEGNAAILGGVVVVNCEAISITSKVADEEAAYCEDLPGIAGPDSSRHAWPMHEACGLKTQCPYSPQSSATCWPAMHGLPRR